MANATTPASVTDSAATISELRAQLAASDAKLVASNAALATAITADAIPYFKQIKTRIEDASALTDHHGKPVKKTVINVLSIVADEEMARAVIGMMMGVVDQETERVGNRLSQPALVADRARQAFEPLHVPSTDAVVELDLKRPMLPAQAHVITAMMKTLQHQKAVFCAAEMGTGKTQIGICTVHAHAAGKPYRAIAMVPPHLVATWQAELAAIFPARAVDVWTLERWDELLLLPRGKLARPLWLIMGETTAKMGPAWQPAAIEDSQGILHCPDCGAQVRSKAKGEGNFLVLQDLEKSKKRCNAEVTTRRNADGMPVVKICNAALWQYAGDARKQVWAPADYIHKQMNGVFDYLIADECFPGDAVVLMASHQYNAISSVVAGEYVMAYDHNRQRMMPAKVTAVHRIKRRERMVRVTHTGGGFVCTEGHRIFANGTYNRAADLMCGDTIYAENLRTLPRDVHATQTTNSVLYQELQPIGILAKAEQPSSHGQSNGKQIAKAASGMVKSLPRDEQRSEDQGEDGGHDAKQAILRYPGGQWSWADEGGGTLSRDDKLVSARSSDAHVRRFRFSEPLQDRPWFKDAEDCNRDRRAQSLEENAQITGQEKGNVSGRARMGGGAVYKCEGTGSSWGGSRGCRESHVLSVETVDIKDEYVYDLTVETHHNYFANGILVHNCHQLKSEDSARATALGALVASCRKVIGMTGTIIGGKASHVRSLLFRMAAKSLRAEDLGWSDSMEFAHRYGRVDTIITEKERGGNDNRRSNGRTRTMRLAEQPGIMPTLYGRHLIANTVFLSLKDVAANLPSYHEHPTAVEMGTELGETYRDMERTLKDAVQKLMRKGSHQLLSPMLHALLAYPDYPYDWKTLGYVDHKDGPNGRYVPIVSPPTLDSKTLWPKERELLKILAAEKSQGRQCWVFACYTSTHPVLGRLEKIVRQAGYRVKVLDAAKVPTKGRSAWIAKNAPDVDVMISHPQPVSTGLTLFDAKGSFNFPSLIFYETGYDTFTLRQASRRSWRIGQKLPCRVYYLYYAESMQARAMALMARKLDASLAMEGQFSAEGLAAMSTDGGGSLAMELAKSLTENIDFGETERIWKKCGEEELGVMEGEHGAQEAIASRPTPLATHRERPLSAIEQLCLFG